MTVRQNMVVGTREEEASCGKGCSGKGRLHRLQVFSEVTKRFQDTLLELRFGHHGDRGLSSATEPWPLVFGAQY